MSALSLKNLENLALPVQKSVSNYVHQLSSLLGDRLVSVLVYGSAAGSNYQPNFSDINLAVIVTKLDFNLLRQSSTLTALGRKNKIVPPLLLTKEYIKNSLDVFPIEFSEIKYQHVLILGEDVFTHLEIPLQYLRIFCEQQIKGKLLRLRQAYMEIGSSNTQALKTLTYQVLNDLFPVLRRLIELKNQKPMAHKEDLLKQVCLQFSLEEKVFLSVYYDKLKRSVVAAQDVEVYVQRFLTQMEILATRIDSL